MKKKFIAAAGATAIGLAIFGLAVPTASAVEENRTTSTPETLVIEAGGLELSGLGTVEGTFGTTDVAAVRTNGFTGTVDATPVVSDFRGGDGTWSLSVKDDAGFAALGASVNVAAGSVSSDEAQASVTSTSVELSTSDATLASASGANGINSLNYTIGLTVPKGTNAKAKTYTDTVTWTLGATALNNGEQL